MYTLIYQHYTSNIIKHTTIAYLTLSIYEIQFKFVILLIYLIIFVDLNALVIYFLYKGWKNIRL